METKLRRIDPVVLFAWRVVARHISHLIPFDEEDEKSYDLTTTCLHEESELERFGKMLHENSSLSESEIEDAEYSMDSIQNQIQVHSELLISKGIHYLDEYWELAYKRAYRGMPIERESFFKLLREEKIAQNIQRMIEQRNPKELKKSISFILDIICKSELVDDTYTGRKLLYMVDLLRSIEKELID